MKKQTKSSRPIKKGEIYIEPIPRKLILELGPGLTKVVFLIGNSVITIGK